MREIPGLEQLPYAEAWFDAADETALVRASAAARALGKSGLEAWTTTRTPEVVPFLEGRGFAEVRRYVISELDVASSTDPGAPRLEVVALSERPGLEESLFELARACYPDQPGRAETRVDEEWFEWGLRAHPPEGFFVALDGSRVLGYGYLEREGDRWRHGFLAVARDVRGRGVAGAIKRTQIRFAKDAGIATLTTATEVRLASMIDLNRRLGYVPVYEEIVLRGPLNPGR